LEALQADKGDSLILHYGDPAKPRFIVIDGGPKDVFRKSLEPRLAQLKRKRPDQPKLPLDMVMVSHIDDDHVRGVGDLFAKLVRLDDDHVSLPYQIGTLWHNSFDDILGNRAEELFSKLAPVGGAGDGEGTSPAPAPESSPAAVAASIAQGRELRQFARRLQVKINDGFEGLVMVPKSGRATVPRAGGLTLTVLAPRQERMEKLFEEWEAQVKSHGWHEAETAAAMAAAFVDRSIYNLSSIVALAEFDSKRILLTGDARGDDILAGLKSAGLAQNGVTRVDIFKLPHHGSCRNAAVELFQQIVADHYVISANGENGNPDTETLAMIAQARGSDAYTIHMTNHEGAEGLKAKLDTFFAAHPAPNRKVVYREATALGLKVDLLDPVDY
jgi:beta-lactamase superfamily II metal-dependent hydrolase